MVKYVVKELSSVTWRYLNKGVFVEGGGGGLVTSLQTIVSHFTSHKTKTINNYLMQFLFRKCHTIQHCHKKEACWVLAECLLSDTEVKSGDQRPSNFYGRNLKFVFFNVSVFTIHDQGFWQFLFHGVHFYHNSQNGSSANHDSCICIFV